MLFLHDFEYHDFQIIRDLEFISSLYRNARMMMTRWISENFRNIRNYLYRPEVKFLNNFFKGNDGYSRRYPSRYPSGGGEAFDKTG